MKPIALFCQHPQAQVWQEDIAALMSQAQLVAWPQVNPAVRYAIVWSPTQAFFDAHPHLELVFNMGAGVDALLKLRLPPKARLVRIEDGGMAVQMAEYVSHAVIRHFRELDVYAQTSAAAQWTQRRPRLRTEFPVGIMGLGVLGSRVAEAVRQFDFPVVGWSRNPREMEGVQCFHGEAQFGDFLAATRILVCMVPLTPQTRGILNHAHLSQLQAGGYVINVARGDHLVEEDLLALLASGHLAGATLDVTRTEPLPADHPLWQDPRVTITPHISAQTMVSVSIAQMVEKIAAAQRGETPDGVVDPVRGY
ncbi:2-hydroxyacid dehydrogenase [Comamonas endophytica]|uniref:Glyoxylate/hydroxypyruvate reductase A n=1 Tax=Comamonas endophytica TaxID=2949090 RepID=A0ABY6G7U5_9BURK|nr:MULTISPECIES: glyoxylate/hydroxypyruvate reductase A [unclassified Acidovorax]MCD2514536.1 glyoxylate/hydroxypyruvate reductase A [Acidovorax sp. D4N7]UYG51116.1 glyoxylate/hydroxypyruvate reductase A [Acidovorax sp. 5MLIR]